MRRQSARCRCDNVSRVEDLSPTQTRLEKTTVHVWRLCIPARPRTHRTSPTVPFLEINDAPPRLERFGTWLSPDERERAARYHFDADRRRFAWTRGVLR